MGNRLDASKIRTKFIPLADIEDHPDNPNIHSQEQVEQLAESHAEFGQYRSIIVWERPGQKYLRVAGHGYSRGAEMKGETILRAEVLPPDTDPLTIEAIMMADNLHARNATQDQEVLTRLLQTQIDAGYSLIPLGANEALQQMLQEITEVDNYQTFKGYDAPPVTFKEYDESIADDLDTEMCETCGKLCLKSGGKKNASFSS